MSTDASPKPSTPQPNDVQSSAQAEIVASALQALRENGVPANGNQDPAIVNALLSIFSQKVSPFPILQYPHPLTPAQPPVADQTKEAAAETLSNLSQAGAPSQDPNIHPQLQAPPAGPESHPHGPPSLGQPQPPLQDGAQTADAAASVSGLPPDSAASNFSVLSTGTGQPMGEKQTRRRGAGQTVNGVIMGSEEWTRQRKDNHVCRTSVVV